MTRVVANEFAKMRHLKVWLLVGLLLLGLAGLTAFQAIFTVAMGVEGNADGYIWKTIFGSLGFSMTMISPILLAVLASRQVEMEHSGNGWLLSATSGVTPGRLCRAKFLALGSLVLVTTVVTSLLLVGFGLAVGETAPIPIGHWLGYTGSAVVINLAVLALHTILSAKIENQLVCIGIGIVGIFLGVFGPALPSWISHLTPWGYYALTTPADFVGAELVYLDIPYLSVAGLAVVGSALFLLITSRFDKQEA